MGFGWASPLSSIWRAAVTMRAISSGDDLSGSSRTLATWANRFVLAIAAMEMGLVKGEGFAVDASVMEANASRYHGKAPDELDWTEKQQRKRAVAEDLADSKPKRRLMAMPRMTTRVVDPRANDSAVMSASHPR